METIAEAATWQQLLLVVPLGMAVVVAAVTDLLSRKIYNWLTFPTVVVGLVVHTIAFGFGGLLTGVVTAVAVLLVGALVLMPIGWLGGGDVKLLAGIGAIVGPVALFEVFFYAAFLGFALGMVQALVTGYLLTLLARVWTVLKSLFLSVTTGTNLTGELETDDRAEMPFAVPILLGTICATTDAFLGWPMFMDWLRETMRTLVLRG